MAATRRLTSLGLVSSDWRRAKARSRCVSAAARCAEVDAASMKRGMSSGRSRRHASANEIERANDAGQKVIEVMGDAAGELADRLHLLGLPQAPLAPPQVRLPPLCSAVMSRPVQ